MPSRTRGSRRRACVLLVLLLVVTRLGAAEQLTPPPDVLPYTTAMTGLSTRAYASAAGAADGSIAVAVSLLFYPGTTVATMGLFAQVAASGDGRGSTTPPTRSNSLDPKAPPCGNLKRNPAHTWCADCFRVALRSFESCSVCVGFAGVRQRDYVR